MRGSDARGSFGLPRSSKNSRSQRKNSVAAIESTRLRRSQTSSSCTERLQRRRGGVAAALPPFGGDPRDLLIGRGYPGVDGHSLPLVERERLGPGEDASRHRPPQVVCVIDGADHVRGVLPGVGFPALVVANGLELQF